MDAKATIQLDDTELEVIFQALTLASDEEKFQGNLFRAKVNEMVARKIFSEKVRFQDRHAAAFEKKYGN